MELWTKILGERMKARVVYICASPPHGSQAPSQLRARCSWLSVSVVCVVCVCARARVVCVCVSARVCVVCVCARGCACVCVVRACARVCRVCECAYACVCARAPCARACVRTLVCVSCVIKGTQETGCVHVGRGAFTIQLVSSTRRI